MKAFASALGLVLFISLSPGSIDASGGRSSAMRSGESAVHKQHLKNRYKPRVYFLSPREHLSTRSPVVPLVIEYVVPMGYVGTVKLWINNQLAVVKPIPGRQRKGQLRIDLDLSPYGPGTHSLRLGGNQGLPGKQSLGKSQLFGTKVTWVR